MYSKTENKKNSSLSHRLASRFTIWFVLCQIFATLVLFLILKQGLREKDQKLAYEEFEEASLFLNDNKTSELRMRFDNKDELLVRVFDATGNVIYDHLPKSTAHFAPKDIQDGLLASALQDGFRTVKPTQIGHETIEIFSRMYGDYRIIVGISTNDSKDFLHLFIKAALATILLSTLLSFLFGTIYSNQILLPIRDLISTIQNIRAGQTRKLAPVSSANDELTELASFFNCMITQINQLITSLQQSLDAIAHDLRTPLTHLIIRHEKFIKSNQATASREFILESMEETQRLASLVTTLLELSEAEAGSLRLKKDTFALKTLFKECADLYEYVAEEKRIRISIPHTDIMVTADRSRLKRAIANLVDNAIKYSDAGATVTLSAAIVNDEAHIRVEDTGWGIPQDDRNKIWERLYRGDISRSTPGMGLGLSFVKSIAELHGGRVSLDDGKVRGTVFELTLPN